MVETSGETALIARAIAGDERALQSVWDQYRRWVAAVLLAHKPKDAELEDLLQEVGMTVMGKASSVRDAAAFKPWLRAVALSVAKTSARKRRVRREGWLRLAGLFGSGEDAHTLSDSRRQALEDGRKLLALSAELPDGYREPLLLKSVQGMSYREIGRVMGLPETTIETRIARARRMLRERAEGAGMTTGLIGGMTAADDGRAGALVGEHA